MTESTFFNSDRLHVAIIMDGNGRWATSRGLSRSAGHRSGVATARRIVECAADLRIGTLTLFAFSSDNWRRPAEEVDTLMWLLRAYLRAETKTMVARGARLSVIGRRDRLPAALREEIRHAERLTAHGTGLHVRIALDYSSREAIARVAANWVLESPPSLKHFGQLVSQSLGGDGTAAQVDLLIRTGGEKRLSDFLLWECAYAELYFSPELWPDYGQRQLYEGIHAFQQRNRRFGLADNVEGPKATVSQEVLAKVATR